MIALRADGKRLTLARERGERGEGKNMGGVMVFTRRSMGKRGYGGHGMPWPYACSGFLWCARCVLWVIESAGDRLYLSKGFSPRTLRPQVSAASGREKQNTQGNRM